MCFQPCSQPLNNKTHTYTFAGVGEADLTLWDPVVSKGKQTFSPPVCSLVRAHTWVQAPARMPIGLSFSHCIILRSQGRNPGLGRKGQIKTLIFFCCNQTSVEHPLRSMPPAWEGDSHFNANCPPFSSRPLPSAFPAPPAPCSPSQCPHSQTACPHPHLLETVGGPVFLRRRSILLWCVQHKAFIPVKFTICSALKGSDSLHPQILPAHVIFFPPYLVQMGPEE